jgi:hypothetical protein
VRTELEAFAHRLLSQLPDRLFPNDAARIRQEYRQKFQQRLEGALRYIEIGPIDGRSIAPKATSNEEITAAASSSLGDAVTLRPTFMRMSIDLLKVWQWVRHRVRLSCLP